MTLSSILAAKCRGLSEGSPRALPRGNAVTAVTSADQGENVCAFSYGQPRLHEAVLCQLPLAAGVHRHFFKSLWT